MQRGLQQWVFNTYQHVTLIPLFGCTSGSSVRCMVFGKAREADCKRTVDDCKRTVDVLVVIGPRLLNKSSRLKGWSYYRTCTELLADNWRSITRCSAQPPPRDTETLSNSAECTASRDSRVPSPLPANVFFDSLPAPSLLVLTEHLNLHRKPLSQLNERL